MRKLTTHVLDTSRGIPAGGMSIELWQGGTLISTHKTNADGRTPPLLEGEALKPGVYELVFFVGDYFAQSKEGAFLGRVPVRFGIDEGDRSYHVPLLCSPWAYSTYRGS
ncbi:MAG: hydroxyisourate hydrolase [Terrimicrobiaceae bacterium]